jgi:hypothetical protein
MILYSLRCLVAALVLYILLVLFLFCSYFLKATNRSF